ncbi:MAG: CapA family protein [Candidatus Omnitrophota bacterium]|nr:CapA family protein [Candidatus Omnitrophota bacterium]
MKLIFVGDIMLGRGVYASLEKNGFEYVFGGIKDLLRNADGVIANLEAPFTNIGIPFKNKDLNMTFKINPDMAPALKHLGISAVTLANNHVVDYGQQGLELTKETLKKTGINFTGAGNNVAEAVAPIEFTDDLNKESIGIFAFNAFTPFTRPARRRSAGVAQFDKITVDYAVKKYKTKYNGFIIILHWGIDYCQFPIPQLIKFVKILIDQYPEIVAIVGHHPHLPQPVIYHKNKPIFCSLGNFIFDEPFALSRIGSMLSLEIENNCIVNHSIQFTKLSNEMKLAPLPREESEIEIKRLSAILDQINREDNEYKKVDKRWIKYLLRQAIRYQSFDNLRYLFTLYSPFQILKKILEND